MSPLPPTGLARPGRRTARPRPLAVIAAATAAAVAAVLAGCGGNPKIARSNTPVPVTTPAGSSGAAASAGGAGGGSAATRSGTFTGVDVPNRYGDVQVSITVRRGRITDVGWVKLPLDRARSRYISQQAAPILRSEVLAAQSARIDVVSGATYTSDSWANSVASALSQVP